VLSTTSQIVKDDGQEPALKTGNLENDNNNGTHSYY
jgi:hypothetical protein